MDLSIIIPAYNVEHDIERTLDSIFSQVHNYQIEVITINGPSSDNTRKVIENYAKSQPNLKFINYDEKNSLGARELGIKNATGRYITFCDGDDRQSEDAISVLVTKMDETGADMINAGFYYEKKNGTRPTFFRKNAVLNQVQLYKYLLKDDYVRGYLWNKIYKAEVLKSVNFHMPSYNIYRDDAYFNFLVAHSINKTVLIKNPIYYYNKVNASTFSGANKSRILSFIKILGFEKWAIEEVNNPKLVKYFNSMKLRRWMQIRFDLFLNKKAYTKKEYKQEKRAINGYLKIINSKNKLPIPGMPWEELIKPYL